MFLFVLSSSDSSLKYRGKSAALRSGIRRKVLRLGSPCLPRSCGIQRETDEFCNLNLMCVLFQRHGHAPLEVARDGARAQRVPQPRARHRPRRRRPAALRRARPRAQRRLQLGETDYYFRTRILFGPDRFQIEIRKGII